MKISSKLSLTLGVAIGALAAGTFAWAAVPDGGPVIHGCVSKKTGTLRVTRTVARTTKCGKKETALVWAKQGPAGIPGALRAPPGPRAPQARRARPARPAPRAPQA